MVLRDSGHDYGSSFPIEFFLGFQCFHHITRKTIKLLAEAFLYLAGQLLLLFFHISRQLESHVEVRCAEDRFSHLS